MILHMSDKKQDKARREGQDKPRRMQDKTMSKAKTQSFVNNNKKNCLAFTKQNSVKERNKDERR
jgi:hypothetical protein